VPPLGAQAGLLPAACLGLSGVWEAIRPGLFALVTTVAALIYQAWGFVCGEAPDCVLAGVCIVLIAPAAYISTAGIPRLRPGRDESVAVK